MTQHVTETLNHSLHDRYFVTVTTGTVLSHQPFTASSLTCCWLHHAHHDDDDDERRQTLTQPHSFKSFLPIGKLSDHVASRFASVNALILALGSENLSMWKRHAQVRAVIRSGDASNLDEDDAPKVIGSAV
jgi:hypothetical protein